MSDGNIEFDFWLRPVEDIEPWEVEGRQRLHWFALSDGYYRITIGGKDLFEYDAVSLKRLGWATPAAPSGFEDGVDYQVARLFHDLTSLLPLVDGDIVPEHAARRLATPGSRAKLETLLGGASDHDPELLDEATGWLNSRCLDSGHLRAGRLPNGRRARRCHVHRPGEQ